MTIEPDDKDWTWVLERPCPECGLDCSAVAPGELPALLEANAHGWTEVLARPDAAVRPAANVWSAVEYGCHVRDVHVLFDRRLSLMLAEDDPEFENWEQDVTAVENEYDAQNPGLVAVQIGEAAGAVAERYLGVGPDAWSRPGRRSNGSTFTVESLGRYHLHDVHHHLYDVGGATEPSA